jgi:tetratricopeptide (TPR) repeat protein
MSFPKGERPHTLALRRTKTLSIPEVELKTEAATEVDIPVFPEDEPQVQYDHLVGIGQDLFSKGKLHESRAIFEGLVVAAPSEAFYHCMLGTVWLAQNDFEQALSCFTHCLKLDENNTAALAYRAEIRLHKKQKKLALADLEKVIAIGKKDDPFLLRAKRLHGLAQRQTILRPIE